MIKGQKASPKALENMRKAAQNRIYTQESKEKMRLSHLGNKNSLGFKHSKETIEKNRINNSGSKNSMFGKHHSEETRKKIGLANKGKKLSFSEEHREKISISKKGANNPWYGKRGEETPNWHGGLSYQPYTIDWTETLRRSIRERDNYLCRLCGKQQGDFSHDIHHIDYDKKNCNPDNLITLCNICHGKTNKRRNYWINFFRLL
jgi:hypothetical protein